MPRYLIKIRYSPRDNLGSSGLYKKKIYSDTPKSAANIFVRQLDTKKFQFDDCVKIYPIGENQFTGEDKSGFSCNIKI